MMRRSLFCSQQKTPGTQQERGVLRQRISIPINRRSQKTAGRLLAAIVGQAILLASDPCSSAPSRFPSDILQNRSPIQWRDRSGLEDRSSHRYSLLSLPTPDPYVFCCKSYFYHLSIMKKPCQGSEPSLRSHVWWELLAKICEFFKKP